jgi:hypothetical protein
MNWELVRLRSLFMMRNRTPKDSRNLELNATRSYPIQNGFIIQAKKALAFYAPFVNGKWISPRWRGKKNPNEGYFEKASVDIIRYVKSVGNGETHNASSIYSIQKDTRTDDPIRRQRFLESLKRSGGNPGNGGF